MLTKETILFFLSTNKELFREKFHVVRIGIFGSYSKGNYVATSDIDIIFEFDEKVEHVYDTKFELREYLEKHFNKSVDLCREKSLNKLFSNKILQETIYV